MQTHEFAVLIIRRGAQPQPTQASLRPDRGSLTSLAEGLCALAWHETASQ